MPDEELKMSLDPSPPKDSESSSITELTESSRAQMEQFRSAHQTQVLTILFTDVVDSTRQQSELGNVRAAKLIQEHQRIFREVISNFDGQEISTAGDSFLVVFAAPSEAVKFSLRMQASMRREREEEPELPLVRAGIHQGQVVVEHRENSAKPMEVYGLQISIAARISDLAGDNQTLCSRAVFDDARAILRDEDLEGLGTVAWRNHGPYMFKGVEDPYDVCEIGEESFAPLAPPPSTAKSWSADGAEEELGWRPAVGVVVPGTNWKLLERLGRDRPGKQGEQRFKGEFGEVWKAWNAGDKSHQVFKFCFKRDRVPALKREARLLKRLRKYRHPNLLEVYDVTESDRPPYYLEMEYVEGPSLEEWLSTDPALQERLEAVAQVADALDTVHAAGIYHRDIKPSNILLTRREDGALQAKLTDFGLGAAEDEDILKSLYTSRVEGVAGTWDYIAPELRKGEAASAQSDIYSLGLTLFQIAAGDLRAQAGPGWEARVESEVLRAEIARCMDPDPAKRPQRATELAVALRGLRARETHLRLQRERERRAGFIKRVAIAATFLAIFAAVPLVYWWQLPGKLKLAVEPTSVRIEVDGRQVVTADGSVSLQLSAGHHRLKMTAPGYFVEERDVMIERYHTRPLKILLRPMIGRLEAVSEPLGSEIEIDGVACGSRVRNLRLRIGEHRLLSWSPGHFEEKLSFKLANEQFFKHRFWLEPGFIWKYTSSATQGGAFLIPDINRDGAPELAQNELSNTVILSGLTRRVLARVAAPRNYARTFMALKLGGAVGRVLVGGMEDANGPDVYALRISQPQGALWRWRGPAGKWRQHAAVPLIAAGDLDADGVSEVAATSRNGKLYLINGRTGKTQREVKLLAGPVHYPPNLARLPLGRLAWWARRDDPNSDPPAAAPWAYSAGAVNPADGSSGWRKDLGKLHSLQVFDLDGDRTPELVAFRSEGWSVVDLVTGRVRGGGKFPAGRKAPAGTALADVDGDGKMEFLFFSAEKGEKLLALRPLDGKVLWEGPAGPHPGQHTGHETQLKRAPGGELLVMLRDCLVALDPRTGKPRWKLEGEPLGMLVGDWEGDGKKEIFVTVRNRGLICLDAGGGERWALRLEVETRPYMLMPDADGDGLKEIVIHRHAALYALVRGPRIFWKRKATAPLLAQPLFVKTSRGSRVLLPGAWKGNRQLLSMDAASGAERWSSKLLRPHNRAPALGDFDADGRPDLAMIGRRQGEKHDRLEIHRVEDGKLVRSVPVQNYGSVYCTPAVADLDGDGTPDLAVSRWDGKDVAAFNGKTGALLWRRKTGRGNMGGAACADLDGDGRPDVVAPSMDGKLYALSGRDGKPLWPPFVLGPGGSRGVPLLNDLTGDKVPDVVVVAMNGDLHVIDGRSGKSIWKATVRNAGESLGRPAVARVGKKTVILAPLGRAGVVALDFAKRTEIWRSPPGLAVVASPVVTDLDGDGRREVVVASAFGRLMVLDLAKGRPLWQLQVGSKFIEAAPGIGDVDGDGILDILIASHDFELTAISGRGTLGTRGRR
jgi:class 3 adenylate cyclase/outer membrane protein assembly factor BamB/predicted Ser/Thr protein kinase